MKHLLERPARTIWSWAQGEYDTQEWHKHLRYFIVSLLPVLASFVIVQMKQQQQHYNFGLVGVLCNSTVTGTASLILSLWHFGLRVLGVSLGLGLGLGLAGHVYDALSDAKEDENRGENPGREGAASSAASAAALNLPRDARGASMDDVNSYHSLMRSAGYSVDNGTLRAQMVRGPQAGVAATANDARRDLAGPRVSVYHFDRGVTASMRMKCMWPNLASAINESLAKLTEFVLRDYVAVWYSKVDEQVAHVVPDPPLTDAAREDSSPDLSEKNPGEIGKSQTVASPSGGGSQKQELVPTLSKSHSYSEVDDASHQKQLTNSYSEGDNASHQKQSTNSNEAQRSSSFPTSSFPKSIQKKQRKQQQQRTMVLTTTGTQHSPFIDSLYSCFAYLLGMLATRASENVNVLQLLLLHLPHILAQNLKIYRQMKNSAMEKKRRRTIAEREKWNRKKAQEGDDGQASPSSFERSGSRSGSSQEGVSEAAVVREYLLAGRFHRALTFGLDVPSLLFADPLAKDCPPGPSYRGNSDIDRLNGHPDEDAILNDRLLSPESALIAECELDYNRVLASKIARLTVPKTEVDSSIVRTMLVEILASCVLGPVMGCFAPESVNGWIVKGLGLLEGEQPEDAAASASASENAQDVGNASGATASMNSDPETNHSVNDETNGDIKILTTSHCSTSVVSEEDDLLDTIVDGIIEDGGSEASETSDMEESLFSMDDSTRKKDMLELSSCDKGEQIITMLSLCLIKLGGFVDFEDCRHAREHGQDYVIDWDANNCRDSVKHLVLTIEAALLLGIRSHPRRQHNPGDRAFSEFEIEATLEETTQEDEFEVDLDHGLVENKVKTTVRHRHASLSAALMELTGDIDAFARLVEEEEQVEDDESVGEEGDIEIFIPNPSELATLRTLIAAWLHTGQVFKVLSIVARAKQTILWRFYHRNAFLHRENNARDFTRLLRQLDGVDILVDTMSVLASRCLLEGNGFDVLMKSLHGKPKARLHQNDPFPEMTRRQKPQPSTNPLSVVGSVKANLAQNRNRIARFAQSAVEIDLNPFKHTGASTQQTRRSSGANLAYKNHHNNNGTPAYLAFSKNDVFASSLRSERIRRKASWMKEVKDRKKLDFVCRTRGIKDKDIMMHRELHHLARFFYSNTNEVRIEPCSFGEEGSPSESAAIVTVKAVGSRRKIEVPDEDSSFLLRAQARPIKPVAIQRDQRNPGVSCKVYAALYEEPAIHPKTKRFYGGRYLRQCLMRYYPSDKTASVTVAQKISVLDGRNGDGDDEFVLTEDFQKLRHTCLKVATGGLLSSPLMDASDFCSTPRTGRAVDFAHRVSLFERPMVELGGKKFIVHDASSHRADASLLELSDASMTAALIIRGSCGLNMCENAPCGFNIEVSQDGTPLVLLRASHDGSSGGLPASKDEARPYRPSFVRAALLVKSSRQEAQSQCLLHCIQSGSARSSSKVKSDEWLQPTLNLLQYANSRRQDEQSALLRDLRFGMNHIDRGQLARNGLLNPRYPTVLRGLNTKVEGVVEVKPAFDFDLLAQPLVLFKIRCTAIAEYVGDEEEDAKSVDKSAENKKSKKAKSKYFREEWTVLRSLKDFSVFHKHIKGQVAPTECSAGTGAKLVGSVSAALTIVGGHNIAHERQRGPLVPSLSQATKVGTLGLSAKKVMEKRKKLLDQYLKYLVSPSNLISRCPELLKFLGAYTCVFPPEGGDKAVDEYGREDIRRVELVTEKLKAGIVQEKEGTEQVSVLETPVKITPEQPAPVTTTPIKADSVDDSATVSTIGTTTVTNEEPKLSKKKKNQAARRMARIRASEIRLKDVRRSLFKLLKDLFDLDNASFFRSRIISVLRTMSVAVTSVQDFHVLLFEAHVNYMNGEWVSGWIYFLVDMFWPGGVFYTKGPPLTEEEILNLKENSKEMLRKKFPVQLRTVLGRHVNIGLDMLHEMLQNRLVLKSMAYMIMDLVWAELFPELGDFLTGAECLEKED